MNLLLFFAFAMRMMKGINQVFGTKFNAIQRVLEMDSNPFTHTGNFVDLLHSQQNSITESLFLVVFSWSGAIRVKELCHACL
ncbi:hypothetical protein HID58_061131 [Brassica napus]|uniref:Uncharacterized protein n=1 Tax=Brassica napus TaxID=3708 RepID=A0ABQ7ZXQ7_BRANA|nr:hypothetical protein HID58_061131 [Brassica napus]